MGRQMKEETTERLADILSNMKGIEESNRFAKAHSTKKSDFAGYFNSYMAAKKLILAEVVEKSGINRNYVYQIINGRKRPSRDKIIALCIGAAMNFTETNRCLKKGGFAPLYPKDERDVHIAVCINRRIASVVDLNISLYEANLELLDV